MNNYIFPFLWMRDQEESVLRNEIAKIDECGIKAVCLESRPHPDFGGDGWWHDFDIVIEEAKKRDMKIWILDDAHFPTGQANGMIPATHPELARKYVMMQHTDCVGPIAQASLDVNLFMTKAFTWLDFGKPVNRTLRNDTRLISVMAYPVVQDDILGNEGIDITDTVGDNGWLTWDVPAGVWRICVSFETYDFGARNEYINYIDEKSVRVLIDAIYEPHYAHYKDEFGKTISGFFSDEPGFYNVDDFSMCDSIGRKKMALPWSDELLSCMDQISDNWRQTLPYLWMNAEEKAISAQARREYMNQVSSLYSRNFSKQLGRWCEDHNVEYIGHVIEDNNEHARLGCGTGHYFRAMEGQHMAGIDTIGGQILPGNPYANRHGVAHIINGQFNHFGLAKMGASAAQIDPKKNGRLMCEAFGAYGWNFGVRNIKWLVDYLLVEGVNHFVPHAFSMANYPDDDCPPHFYARGNNPQFRFFAETMKYANRMCDILNGGKNVPVVALVYPAEHEWMENSMEIQVPGRVLQENQIDYEILPIDALVNREKYGTKIRDNKLIVNERSMEMLLVPETEFVDPNLAQFIIEAAASGLEVAFIESAPKQVVAASADVYDKLMRSCRVIRLADLAPDLKASGKYDISLSSEAKNLLYYHYNSDEDIYFLFNSSVSESIKTEITLKSSETFVAYDGWKDEYRMIPQQTEGGRTTLAITLAPYESLMLTTNRKVNAVCVSETIAVTDSMDISADWEFAMAKALDYPKMSESMKLEKLIPVSQIDFEFAGIMRYEKRVALHEIPSRMIFSAEHIYEVAELFVNGKSAGVKVTPGYEWNITDLVEEGENSIVIEVANTPTRDSLKNPGIFGPAREILEPSGMFGRVELRY